MPSVAFHRVTHLGVSVADDADDGHVIKPSECFRHFTFALEQFLACMTPRLKIVRIARVLDKACRLFTRADEMPADHS